MGDGVIVREGAVVHRSTKPGGFTEVGPGSWLMGFCHLGHDCHLGARVLVGNTSLLAGHVDVGDDCFLSGGTGFHQFIRIGEGSMVGGNGRMSLDVPPYTLCAERNELYGLNIVGLRRRKFAAATISELKQLYKAVYQSPSLRKNAGAAAGLATTEHGKKFLAFFAGGKRGFIRPPSAGTQNPESDETQNAE
jgi:UDP-N-acetylglucosamine acyltransferase